MYLVAHDPSPPPTACGPYASSSSMSTSIQGLPLEVTVVGCNKLKDTEWISRQDPYVCLEYASSKFRTRTCTDGHKTPVFQEKFVISLIEGLREINVTVWNSNTLSVDDFIGSGRVQLQKVLSQGYDDSVWSLQSKRGREQMPCMFLQQQCLQQPVSHHTLHQCLQQLSHIIFQLTLQFNLNLHMHLLTLLKQIHLHIQQMPILIPLHQIPICLNHIHRQCIPHQCIPRQRAHLLHIPQLTLVLHKHLPIHQGYIHHHRTDTRITKAGCGLRKKNLL